MICSKVQVNIYKVGTSSHAPWYGNRDQLDVSPLPYLQPTGGRGGNRLRPLPQPGDTACRACGALQRTLILRAHCSRTTVWSWRGVGAVGYAHRWKSIFRPERGECSRGAEPVKAKPCGLLRKPCQNLHPSTVGFQLAEKCRGFPGRERGSGALPLVVAWLSDVRRQQARFSTAVDMFSRL